MLEQNLRHQIETLATRVRFDIVKMTYHAGSGHPGGSLSVTDIIAVLYKKHLRHNPQNPQWAERDRVVFSKGHAAPALYSILAECGYFPRAELWTLRKLGSRLQGHPALLHGVPGTEVATGSLGQGISVAVGMALSDKLDKNNRRVFALLGDGEIEEGQVWEAFMSAAHYGLSNLCIIIDNNDLQIDGCVRDVMNIHPIPDKLKAFNWNVITIDGHNIDAIDEAFATAKNADKPTAIIAKTIKGKGISFMENDASWHGKAPKRQQAIAAIEELGFPASAIDEDIK